MGAAVRAVGQGLKVLVVQFFKDGTSGEIRLLEALAAVDVLYVQQHLGRYKNMTEREKETASEKYGALFRQMLKSAEVYDVIILDEVVSAYHYGVIERDKLLGFMGTYAGDRNRELYLTGRNPAQELAAMADYITEMKKERHPYDKGIAARKGVEW